MHHYRSLNYTTASLLSSREGNKRPFLASEHRGRDPTCFSPSSFSRYNGGETVILGDGT